MKYTFYGYPVSPFSYLVHFSLIHKEVDFNFVFVNLPEGEQKKAEYLKTNPHGVVPSLVRTDSEPEQCFYESWAIFEYLEESFPQKPLLPKEEPLRSRVRAAAHSMFSEIIPNARPLFLEKLGRKKLSDEEREKTVDLLTKKLEILQSELSIIKSASNYLVFDAIFYQVWNNITFAFPALKQRFAELDNHHHELAKSPIIQKIENIPEIIKVREFFKTMTSK